MAGIAMGGAALDELRTRCAEYLCPKCTITGRASPAVAISIQERDALFAHIDSLLEYKAMYEGLCK